MNNIPKTKSEIDVCILLEIQAHYNKQAQENKQLTASFFNPQKNKIKKIKDLTKEEREEVRLQILEYLKTSSIKQAAIKFNISQSIINYWLYGYKSKQVSGPEANAIVAMHHNGATFIEIAEFFSRSPEFVRTVYHQVCKK